MILNVLKILPFIVAALAILFGSHYLLYRWVIGSFDITGPVVKNILFACVAFLSLSFIFASLISHFSQSQLAKMFYIAAGSWLGFLTNLLLAIFLIWAASRLLPLVGLNIKLSVIAAVFFSLAILFSVYGIWNAFNPRIKNIEVTIKNLPSQWQEKTIVQLSDVHLGKVHGAKFMRDIAQKANSLNPELIVITGDLFDGMDGDLSSLIESLNSLQSARGVFFVTGNHETFLGLNEVFELLDKTEIKVLNNGLVNLDGLQIIGVGYTRFTGEKNLTQTIESLPNFEKDLPSVLLYHSPTNIDQAKAAGVNLQLSGHTHRGQIFPIHFFEWLIYKKYYYGLYREENYTIYTSAGTGTWGPPMRTGNVPEITAIKLK